MRIALCCHLPLDPKLGGAKVYLEAAESYRRLGAQVKLFALTDWSSSEAIYWSEQVRLERLPSYLHAFINKNGHQFDVIEYEMPYLGHFTKNESLDQCLLVARSVLLPHHLQHIHLPYAPTIRGWLGKILKSGQRKKELLKLIAQCNSSVSSSNFFNVPNIDDEIALLNSGHEKIKSIVSPYGLLPERLEVLSQFKKTSGISNFPNIAFVGTFDWRKGAREFPAILTELKKFYPNIKLKLLGTSALFPTESSVIKHFGSSLAKSIQVVPKFNPEELPNLLQDQHLGIFPSHLESYGFGVLEMLASGLPTIGYSVPGVSSLLPENWRVPRGDFQGLINLARKILMADNYAELSTTAVSLAKEQSWTENAQKALTVYKSRIENLSEEATP